MKTTEFLLEIIEKQSEIITCKDEYIEMLKNEIKRLEDIIIY